MSGRHRSAGWQRAAAARGVVRATIRQGSRKKKSWLSLLGVGGETRMGPGRKSSSSRPWLRAECRTCIGCGRDHAAQFLLLVHPASCSGDESHILFLTCVRSSCRVKLPNLSLEEVITGCVCVAIGGLFISFVI